MTDINMNLYDINKSIMAKQKPMKPKQGKQAIRDSIQKLHNNYYMLLCKEISYYTLFHINPIANERIEDIVFELLEEYGMFYTLDSYEDHLEIWVRFKENNEMHVFMFFPYDLGVIECQ